MSKVRKVQEESAPTTKSAASSPSAQLQPPKVTLLIKKPAMLTSPASARPSSLEELMAKSMPKVGMKAAQVENIPKSKEEPQQKAGPVQQPAPAKEKAALQLKPPIMMGKALEQSSPPPKVEPLPRRDPPPGGISRIIKREVSRTIKGRGSRTIEREVSKATKGGISKI